MKQTKLVKEQTKTYGPKVYTENGREYRITAHVRHDDQCGNGHNTFSITGEIDEKRGGVFREYSGGCIHDDIAKHFPELAVFIKWHLTSTDGPLHYIANTVYHAGDRDHNGLRAGEKRQLVNGRTKLPVWERNIRNEAGEVVKTGGGDWIDAATKPTEKLTVDFEPVWIVGEGKKRELDHARHSAVWPEATDAELCQEPEALKKQLLSRHPALMVEFQRAVESLGFTF
jgi:hypothetical protein